MKRFCSVVALLQLAQNEAACPKMDLKVAKAMYDKGYNKVRVSVVTTPDTEKDCDFGDFFDYNEKFYGVEGNNMMTFNLRTALKEVEPGAKCALDIAGEKVIMNTPKAGARVRGLLFSDPCIRQQLPGPACPLGDTFKVKERFSKAINELVGSDEVDFWGILGDNWYDATGKILIEFAEELSLQAKSKAFITVPGNHDFWNAGAPELGQPGGVDHFGYGFLQYYGLDVVASNATHPYDFSIKPAKSISDPPVTGIPELENFVFYHQIGNTAHFGQSGAHGTSLNPATSHSLLDPYMKKFCDWVGGADDIHTLMIYGHWNGPNLGCQPGMSAVDTYKNIMKLEGCSKKKGLYFTGHDHCNRLMPNSWVGTDDPLTVGFMIGASGMKGDCSDMSGFVIVDSMPDAKDGPNAAVDYYPADDAGKWAALTACWEANPGKGHTMCRQDHAEHWREVAEGEAKVELRPYQLSDGDVPTCGQPSPAPGPSPSPTPGGKSGSGMGSTTIIIICAVAAVVVIGGIAAAVLMKRRGQGGLNSQAGLSLEASS